MLPGPGDNSCQTHWAPHGGAIKPLTVLTFFPLNLVKTLSWLLRPCWCLHLQFFGGGALADAITFKFFTADISDCVKPASTFSCWWCSDGEATFLTTCKFYIASWGQWLSEIIFDYYLHWKIHDIRKCLVLPNQQPKDIHFKMIKLKEEANPHSGEVRTRQYLILCLKFLCCVNHRYVGTLCFFSFRFEVFVVLMIRLGLRHNNLLVRVRERYCFRLKYSLLFQQTLGSIFKWDVRIFYSHVWGPPLNYWFTLLPPFPPLPNEKVSSYTCNQSKITNKSHVIREEIVLDQCFPKPKTKFSNVLFRQQPEDI